MKIAAIIVNWNAGELLCKAVESLLTQNRLPDRIIIADNDSSDNSLELLAPYRSQIEIVSMGSNLGFASANNRVIQELGDCEWVALLNPDAEADPNWLAEWESAVQNHPDVAVFASRMMISSDDEKLDGAGDMYHISGHARRRFHGRRLVDVDASDDYPVFSPCGGAAFYKRQAFLACGGFDDNFFCFFEDVDLAFRMHFAKQECWYIHRAVVKHVGGGISGKYKGLRTYYGHRNLTWAWFKNMPLPLLVCFFPVHVLLTICVILLKTTTGDGAQVLSAKIDAVKGLPRIFRQRKSIHGSKQISSLELLSKLKFSPLGFF